MARRHRSEHVAAARLWQRIRAAAYWLDRHACDSAAGIDLLISDFAVLDVLRSTGPLPVNDIGAKVLLSSGSMTTSIDRLEKAGLVKRTAHLQDRRAALVSLTRSGARNIARAARENSERLTEVMSVLSSAQQDELARLIERLAAGAKQLHPAGMPRRYRRRRLPPLDDAVT
jgi:MarR family 2-MHQ and catechol resistance regulon transcriptional repressor